jgi:hypothetical protein
VGGCSVHVKIPAYGSGFGVELTEPEQRYEYLFRAGSYEADSNPTEVTFQPIEVQEPEPTRSAIADVKTQPEPTTSAIAEVINTPEPQLSLF